MLINDVTLIIPFYRNCKMLAEQVRHWENYPDTVRIVVVDDGSPEPAELILRDHVSPALRERLALYRIDVDIPWNRGGARNLGTRMAPTEWIIHVDIDHVMPAESMRYLVHQFEADQHKWYRFERWRRGRADETRMKDRIPREVEFGRIHPHIDSYLCTRSLYWLAGGYDEDYSGCLGGGSPFVAQLSQSAEMKMAPPEICLHVYTRSVIPDASVSTLSRDREEYARRRQKKERNGRKIGHKPIRFPWTKVI